MALRGPCCVLLMVPPMLTLLQTEFYNPVFEGEEPRAAPSTGCPADEDGSSPTSQRDGLGTSLGFAHRHKLGSRVMGKLPPGSI